MRSFRRLTVHSALPGDGACWSAAKRAEYDLYAMRNGWVDDDTVAAGEVLDFRAHEARSEIFVVTSATDWSTPVGVARMIWGVADLPLEEQFIANVLHRIDGEWQWMLEHIGGHRLAEWASLGAVGANLSPMFAMWAAAYAASRARGVDYWMQTVVEDLFSVYRDGFRAPMMRMGERATFFGVDWVPTILSLDEIGVGQMLSWNPDLKRSMFDEWVDRRQPSSR